MFDRIVHNAITLFDPIVHSAMTLFETNMEVSELILNNPLITLPLLNIALTRIAMDIYRNHPDKDNMVSNTYEPVE